MSEKDQNNYDTEIEESVNIVGMNKRKKVITTAVVLIALGLGYYFFFKDKNTNDQINSPQTTEGVDIEKLLKDSVPPTQEVSPAINIPPQLPELPPLVAPSLPSIPTIEKPKVLEVPKIPLPTPVQSVEIASPIVPATTGYDRERRATSMLAISGGQDTANASPDDKEIDNTFSKGSSVISLQPTSSPNIVATKINNLEYTILQGKIIDVVLETAINSDLQGTLRGIIARDVYSESNNVVMIPKGSRLIGNYSFDSSPGKTRVQISWNRVILPHGIDIAIDSSGTDELGRHGASGVVDTKIGNILTSTILLAGVSIATSYATSKIPEINNNPISESKSGEEKGEDDKYKSTTKTTLPVKILSKAVEDFSQSIKDIIQKYSNNNPTVYVDQGTLLKVFVNKDIVFPRSAVRGIDMVN